MKPVFADSSYFFAILHAGDRYHSRASALSQRQDQSLVTTVWVLTEVGDGLSRSANRRAFQNLLDYLRRDPDSVIVSADHETWERGVVLYSRRADKHWSLTDCISFEVMRDLGLSEALTGDHHFEQAGFTILLK